MSLIDVARSKILGISENNQKRWKRFAGDFPLTFDRFSQKLEEFEITDSPDEASRLWGAFGVRGKEIQFGDFIKFIQSDIQPQQRQVSPKATLLIQMYEKRRQLIDQFLSLDPSADGYLPNSELASALNEIGISAAQQEIKQFIDQHDIKNAGKMNYFEIMHVVSLSAQKEDTGASGPRSKLDPRIFGTKETSSVQQPTGARTKLDPSIFGEASAEEQRPKKVLESTIFGKTPEEEGPRNQARGELDPAIFGERPAAVKVEKPPAAELDLSKTRDCTDYDSNQTISLIARFANKKFRSVRDCFGEWRGTEDRLRAIHIFRGMAKDAGVELNRDLVDSIVQGYGGELTVSSFTRLISDGARIDTPEPAKEAPPPPTETDILFGRIAKELNGKPWEAAIKTSKNALDLARNLKKLGVAVKSDELRPSFEDMGMKKIIEDIKARQAPPKKRRQ